MNKKIVTINGDNFSDLASFFNEIDQVFTKNLEWRTGHNMNALTTY
jgi:RNAse (barnase) inhibitor barstar